MLFGIHLERNLQSRNFAAEFATAPSLKYVISQIIVTIFKKYFEGYMRSKTNGTCIEQKKTSKTSMSSWFIRILFSRKKCTHPCKMLGKCH